MLAIPSLSFILIPFYTIFLYPAFLNYVSAGCQLKSSLQQAAGNLPGRDFIYLIRSLLPQQATGKVLAIAGSFIEIRSGNPSPGIHTQMSPSKTQALAFYPGFVR